MTERGIPVSTLKLNAKILKRLGLIDFSDGKEFRGARLTETGAIVAELANSYKTDVPNNRV